MNETAEPVSSSTEPPAQGSAPVPPPPRPSSERQFRRARNGSVSGVSAGLAHYLGVDVNIVRIAFVVGTLLGGVGVLIYLAAWILVPEAGDADPAPIAIKKNWFSLLAGGGVLLAGGIVLLATTDLVVDDSLIVGLGLLALGWWVLNQRDETSAATGVMNPAGSASVAMPPPPVPANPSSTSNPSSTDVELVDATMPMVAPVETSADVEYWAAPRLESEVQPTVPVVPVEPGPPITSTTLGIVTLAIGLLLVLRTVFGLEIQAVAMAGTATAIIGGGLVASAFLGRARWLWFFGMVSLFALAISPLLDSAINGGVGDRNFVVRDVADLQPIYELGMGELVVDLRDLPAGVNQEIQVKLGAGYAEVIVPRNATVIVEADARVGYVEVERDDESGVDPSIRTRWSGSDETVLTIDADVTFGALEIRRG